MLDEVDRLLDLGFGPQINEIVSALRRGATSSRATTVLVTATITSALEALASKHLGGDRVLVSVDGAPSPGAPTPPVTTPPTLHQTHAIVTLKLRLPALCAMLRDRPAAKTLVFANTCASSAFHAALFQRDAARERWGGAARRVGVLHGQLGRDDRRGAYEEFCREPAAVLFATDVAARGLDFDRASVDWVIHLDAPRDAASYVHRAGRAARAGRAGASTLLLLPSERPVLDALRLRLAAGAPPRAAVASRESGFSDADASASCGALERCVKSDEDLASLARAAFAAHARAYAGGTRDVADAAEREALGRAFHVRKLHLGHAARAYALREKPEDIVDARRRHRSEYSPRTIRAVRPRRSPRPVRASSSTVRGRSAPSRRPADDDDATQARKTKRDREASKKGKRSRADEVKGGTTRTRLKKAEAERAGRKRKGVARTVGSTTKALRLSSVSEFGA